MESAAIGRLKAALEDVHSVFPEPMWDLMVYCRFLAGRLPASAEISAPDLVRLAEELIEDLGAGLDRRRGEPFSTPLLNDRSELVYHFFRQGLVELVRVVAGDPFADQIASGLQPAPGPAPADAVASAAAPE